LIETVLDGTGISEEIRYKGPLYDVAKGHRDFQAVAIPAAPFSRALPLLVI